MILSHPPLPLGYLASKQGGFRHTRPTFQIAYFDIIVAIPNLVSHSIPLLSDFVKQSLEKKFFDVSLYGISTYDEFGPPAYL